MIDLSKYPRVQQQFEQDSAYLEHRPYALLACRLGLSDAARVRAYFTERELTSAEIDELTHQAYCNRENLDYFWRQFDAAPVDLGDMMSHWLSLTTFKTDYPTDTMTARELDSWHAEIASLALQLSNKLRGSRIDSKLRIRLDDFPTIITLAPNHLASNISFRTVSDLLKWLTTLREQEIDSDFGKSVLHVKKRPAHRDARKEHFAYNMTKWWHQRTGQPKRELVSIQVAIEFGSKPTQRQVIRWAPSDMFPVLKLYP